MCGGLGAVEPSPRPGTAPAPDKLTVGSLFSGIGGLDLGLERAGMIVIWQSEIDPYASRVLAKHWPTVPNLGDITKIDWGTVERPDLICGGFPCQPASTSGSRRGVDDDRWLWPEVARCIGVVRPRYVVVENVAGLLTVNDGRAMAEVVGDLASLRYDADWSIVSACAMGAPHARERLFIVAHSASGNESDHLSHHLRQADRNESRGSRGRTWGDGWLPEPPMDRVAHGVPSSMVRAPLHALGNAVVPQVAELVGRRILKAAA
jgi:DNA (cytosine-5)-methyltransferase 1